MEPLVVEILPLTRAPSSDAGLVLIEGATSLIADPEEVRRHLLTCASYAKKYTVCLLSGLFLLEDALCLCLFGPDGLPIDRQVALCEPMPLQGRTQPGQETTILDTPFGRVFLCVDEDIRDQRVLRTAALKGAGLVLSVRMIDVAEDTVEELYQTAWNTAQTQNLYVISHSAAGCSVCCPAPLTRAQDGFLVRRETNIGRFILNFDRLDEVRQQLPLLDALNTEVFLHHQNELGR